MRLNRRRASLIAYLVGIISLLVAAVWLLVNLRFDRFVQVGLALFVASLVAGVLLDPDRLQRALSARQARYGVNALLMAVSFAGILGVVNYLAVQTPMAWDLTEDQVYTLAPESVRVLEGLEQPVILKAFYTADRVQARAAIKPLLEQYVLKSQGLLEYEFVDARRNPFEARQFGISRDGMMVVILGDEWETLTSISEQEVSSAIIRLANPGERRLLFVTGHGERDLDASGGDGYSGLSSALRAKNYQMETTNLLAEPTIPGDALVLIIAGPRLPLSSDEVGSIDAYVAAGGSLIVLYEPTPETEIQSESDPLAAYLLESWQIDLRDDVLVDPDSSLPLVPIGRRYADHPVTSGLATVATYFPTARSLSVGPIDQAQGRSEALVFTGGTTWGESDLEAMTAEGSAEFDEGSDHGGPLTLAAVAQGAGGSPRVLVFGDSDFAANAAFPDYANGDLLVNSIDWAAGEEALIDLTPRQQTARFVADPSIGVFLVIILTTVILMPGGVAAAGAAVWWSRRRGK